MNIKNGIIVATSLIMTLIVYKVVEKKMKLSSDGIETIITNEEETI